MKAYTPADLEKFLSHDELLPLLQATPELQSFQTQKWLLNMPEKRLITQDIYRNLLSTSGKKILDIGGGISALTKLLVASHEYTNVEILAHENFVSVEKLEEQWGKKFLMNQDWNDFVPEGHYDYIIANDLFPNVDQRLTAFIKKFAVKTDNLILTITCATGNKFYPVRRLDGEEIFFMQAWDRQLATVALQGALGEQAPVLEETITASELFANGRVVYKMVLC